MKWERNVDLIGRCDQIFVLDTVHFYSQVNEKRNKFHYKRSIITCCREYWRDFVQNLTCLGHPVFWVTMEGPGEMSLTKVIQRSWYWRNYYFLPNFDNPSCCDSTSLRNHSWDLLVLCGRCNSTDNWTYTVMKSNGCYTIWQANSKYCKVQMSTENSNIESLN